MTAPAINRHRFLFLCASVLLVLSGSFHDARAREEVILHAFSRSEGVGPSGRPVLDTSGNLYGTTGTCEKHLCGTLFKLAPDGTETTIHTFVGKKYDDGSEPAGGLARDKAGYLYGTTIVGGGNCHPRLNARGCGTVFQIAPDGTEKILHEFGNLSDGVLPSWGVTPDRHGNLYGTTQWGGVDGCQTNGCGVLFRLAPDGTYKVLHAFSTPEGGTPSSRLTIDSAGNIYGETDIGGVGCAPYGCGTIYKIARDGTYSVIYAFLGGSDGQTPAGDLIFDSLGNLYGTTDNGGLTWGVAFKVAPDGSETVLHRFAGGNDGAVPVGMIVDKNGDLFGVTEIGGGTGCGGRGCGTIFKISPDGTEKILYAYEGGVDGALPVGGVISDGQHNLYGVTFQGGVNNDCIKFGCGTVFELKH